MKRASCETSSSRVMRMEEQVELKRAELAKAEVELAQARYALDVETRYAGFFLMLAGGGQ